MLKYTDKAILEKLNSGDDIQVDQGLSYLYQEYYGMIANFISRNNGSESDAEDIFQDGLISFYNQSKDGLELSCSIKTYIYSICRNLWLTRLKKAKRQTPLQTHHEYIEVADDLLDNIISTERSQTIADMLGQMGEDCQKVLLYYYYERLRMKKIMELMNYGSEQVAKNKKAKCMKRLRSIALESPALKQFLS